MKAVVRAHTSDWVKHWALMLLMLGLGCMALGLSGLVRADEWDQAKRIHDRIAGVPPDDATLILMRDELLASRPITAALIATNHSDFYNVTLKNLAAPWTNRDRSVFVPLNDYTATVIGMVLQDQDFREILYGDVLYIGNPALGLPSYSNSDNDHYARMEELGVDLKANLVARTQSSMTGIPSGATAGVMTTRAAAQAFFIMGTNRAMFRFTMINHMCRDLEQVLDTSRSPDRIRQDVPRSPGGDSRTFLNNCIGCHSGMDPMTQAFAYYDFAHDAAADPEGINGTITYNDVGTIDPITGTRVVSKYFNNAANFPFGFVTPDDEWDNYWRAGPNAVLGWDIALTGAGNGAKGMGQELAHSEAFASCQVTKVFKNVCLRSPADSADHIQIDNMVASFGVSGYSLRQVFAESAAYCRGS
jgi:hypothetical protein